jgi:hypothetical protein
VKKFSEKKSGIPRDICKKIWNSKGHLQKNLEFQGTFAKKSGIPRHIIKKNLEFRGTFAKKPWNSGTLYRGCKWKLQKKPGIPRCIC